MKKIFKYTLTKEHRTNEIPLVKVLSIQIQRGVPVMWCLVDTEIPMKKVTAIACGTGGADCDVQWKDGLQYISTTQYGDDVRHWFVDIEG
jgi:hypothetical protein